MITNFLRAAFVEARPVWMIVAILAANGLIAEAQSQPSESPRSFDVASVKVNRSGERIMLFQPMHGGRFTANNSSLSLLIQYAYQVMQFQISGAPDWSKSDRYDISAKVEGDPPIEKIPAMLQRLLEDRFQLKYHWETKEGAVYNLVVSRADKLKDSGPGDCAPVPPGQGGPPDDAPCGALRNTPGHTKGYRLTAGELAGNLSFFVQRFVLDKTGLPGKYDIDLQWTPDSVLLGSSPTDAAIPSIFTALQEQLGLKLESAKGPVKMFVIDHVQRSSEN